LLVLEPIRQAREGEYHRIIEKVGLS